MGGRTEDALFCLRNGEFEKAKQIFSLCLDEDPELLEWVEGYFVASFWDNKLDHLLRLREGKERGSALLRYLESFETEVTRRGLPRLMAYQESVQCVLEETTRNLSIAFRLEGWNGLDADLLKGLASCHIRLRQYEKALEVLSLVGNSLGENPDAEKIFLKADALLGIGREQEGLYLYLIGFLEDPFKLPLSTLHWEKIRKAIPRSKIPGNPESFVCLICPYILLRENTWEEKIKLLPSDFRKYFQIFQKLSYASYSSIGESRKKAVLRTGFLAEALSTFGPGKEFIQEILKARKFLQDTAKEINDLLPL